MTLPFETARISPKCLNRRSFIGGSDARVIMGSDEAALLRLWREKRGEVEPEDLSANLVVQLGLVTEPLNRHWFERNTGQVGLISCARVSAGMRLLPSRRLQSIKTADFSA